MKSMLVGFLTLLVGSVTWACPQINGTFQCQDESVTIRTYTDAGVTYYETDGDAMPADSQWYSLPDSDDQKNGRIRLSCGSNNSLGDYAVMDYEADLYDQNKYVANLDAEIYLRMVGEDLQQDVVGKVKGSWGEQPISESVLCIKE